MLEASHEITIRNARLPREKLRFCSERKHNFFQFSFEREILTVTNIACLGHI